VRVADTAVIRALQETTKRECYVFNSMSLLLVSSSENFRSGYRSSSSAEIIEAFVTTCGNDGNDIKRIC
jgi:hypothetical protein